MKLNRFIFSEVKNKNINEKIIIEEKKLFHQIKKVFRAKTGDFFVLCDNNHNDFLVEILEINKNKIEVQIKEIQKLSEPEREIFVFVAPIKPVRFDEMLPHLVEVGATKIIPIWTKRTQKRNLKTERLEEILKEATEQSGRGKIPKLEKSLNFEEALLFCQKENIRTILFHKQNKKRHIELKEKVGIFIGPEGGFTDEEVNIAERYGTQSVSLGKNTLRAETAGVVATYLVWQNLI